MAKHAPMVAYFYGVIVSGVLGAGRRAARQAPTVACFYAIVFQRRARSKAAHGQGASTVAFFYGIMWRRWREQCGRMRTTWTARAAPALARAPAD